MERPEEPQSHGSSADVRGIEAAPEPGSAAPQSHASVLTGAAAASDAATTAGSIGAAAATKGGIASPMAMTAPQDVQRARSPPGGTRLGSMR